jgi:hypothetical protein
LQPNLRDQEASEAAAGTKPGSGDANAGGIYF